VGGGAHPIYRNFISSPVQAKTSDFMKALPRQPKKVEVRSKTVYNSFDEQGDAQKIGWANPARVCQTAAVAFFADRDLVQSNEI